MTETTSTFTSWRMRFHTKAQPYLIPFFIASSAFILYARILDVYFNSDDFILLRTVSGHSLPGSITDHLTSPWLSLRFFMMYRPVASLFFYLIYPMFGLNPFGYHLLGISCHVVNAMLVSAITNSLTNRKNVYIGYAAGLLFALHPLHPNAVAWVSAFPTVLSTSFVLVSLLSLLHFREGGLIRWYLFSLAAFLLALGTYEPVIVYPALLIGCDWLKSGWTFPHKVKTLAAVYIPYVVLVCAYVLVRKTLLGPFYFEEVLGYQGGLVLERMTSFPRVMVKMFYPLFSLDPLERAVRLGFFACFAVSIAISVRRLLAEKEHVRIGLFVLFWTFLWTVVTEPVLSPSVGRYSYVASIGVCIGLSFLMIGLISFPAPGRKYLGASVLLLGVVFCYVRLLNQSLIAYEKAGKLTRTIQQQLVALDARSEGTHTYFMGNVPQYVTKDGYHFAQVLITGLADSVRPPFTDREMRIYPFINFANSRELPSPASSTKITLLTWNERLEQVQVVASPYPEQDDPRQLPNIEVLYPPDKDRVRGFGHNLGFAFAGHAYERFRFVVITAYGKPFLFDVSRDMIAQLGQLPSVARDRGIPEYLQHVSPGDKTVSFTLSRVVADIFSSVQDIYGGETFWWVEALDERGQVVARSTMKSFRMEEEREDESN